MAALEKITHVKKVFADAIAKGEIKTERELISFFQVEEKLETNIFIKWLKAVTQFTFLTDFTTDLEEIFLYGPTQIIYKSKDYKKKFESDITKDDLQLSYDYLTLKNKIAWNYQKPFKSFYATICGKKARVTLAHFSMSSDFKSSCFIRFHSTRDLSLKDFQLGDKEQIESMVYKKKNILIAGNTGSGKTSFLSCLLALSDPKEHLLILEDTVEIKPPHKNVTRLISDSENPAKSLNKYMSYAMRMSPDRIALGEMRSTEVEPFLLAMNTGHKGLMSTIHANSAKEALERVALLFKIYSAQDLSFDLVLKLVCSNIDYVVFMNNKKVDQIISVFGSEKQQVFFEDVSPSLELTDLLQIQKS